MTSLIVTKGQVVAKLARGTPTILPRSYSKDLKEETRIKDIVKNVIFKLL